MPLNMCRKADTVAEGFLCDEPLVTANACRQPTNKVDLFLCDDRKMAAAQEGAWEVTKGAVKLILAALLGARK
jgi:hypothetical protein